MFSSLAAGARSTMAIACGWQHVRVTTTTLSWDVVPVDKPDDVNVVIGRRTSLRRSRTCMRRWWG